jgi:hypothetical protein
MVELKELIQVIEEGEASYELTKKRFACARCGNTWTEVIGAILVHNDGNEELHLRIGMESESCQVCQLQVRNCQKCGSKDVYEMSFGRRIPQETCLNFKGIRTVSRR